MNKLIGRTSHRLCTFSTSIREIREIKYYFNICGIRKENERRGLRKGGGGWKFTPSFTSPGSLPASPSSFSHSLLSSTGSFSGGCDRSFSPFEDSCVFFKTRRFFGMIVQVNIEGSSFLLILTPFGTCAPQILVISASFKVAFRISRMTSFLL